MILKGIQIGLANPIFKSPTANSNDTFGLDLVTMSTGAPRQRLSTDERSTSSSTILLRTNGLIVGLVRRGIIQNSIAWRGGARLPLILSEAYMLR